MGAWGSQPLENDTAWDIIGLITDRVTEAVIAALAAGDARRARHAIWLLGQMDARLPAVLVPESDVMTAWRQRLLLIATGQPPTAAEPPLPLAAAIAGQELARLVEEGLDRDSDLGALAALGVLALLAPSIDDLTPPPEAMLADWERRYWLLDRSGWRDPDSRAQAARETFAALRARRLPTTTNVTLMERVDEYLRQPPPNDASFGTPLNDGLE